jgi:hypothetical protein
MDAFKNIDFSFGNSREGAFVEKLLEVSTSLLGSSATPQLIYMAMCSDIVL